MRDLAKYVDPDGDAERPVRRDRGPQEAPRSEARRRQRPPGEERRRAAATGSRTRWFITAITPTEAGAALGLTADEVTAAAKRLRHRRDAAPARRPAIRSSCCPIPAAGTRASASATARSARSARRRSASSRRGRTAATRSPTCPRRSGSSRRRRSPSCSTSRTPTSRRPGTSKKVALDPLEWTRKPDGSLSLERTLPNKVTLAGDGHAGQGRRADGVSRDERLDREAHRPARADVRDARGPDRLRQRDQRQQGLRRAVRRVQGRDRQALDHHRLGAVRPGLGQPAVPVPARRPGGRGLPAGPDEVAFAAGSRSTRAPTSTRS